MVIHVGFGGAMYLSGIRIQGMRGAEEFSAAELGSVVVLPSGPAGIAVADALALFAAALDRSRCKRWLVDIGVARLESDVEVVEEGGFPVQISVPDSLGVRPLLPPDGRRQVSIALDVALDPPLFGQLRQEAVRDPRLVGALGRDPSVTIKVGWLFTNDLTTASVSVLSVGVGDAAFATSGQERPAWLGRLLDEVGRRFRRVGHAEPPQSVADRLYERSLSPVADLRARFRRASDALASPPFELGVLEFVRTATGVEPRFGAELSRSRQFGPTGAEALRLVEAVLVDAPDVLVVEAPGIAQRSAAAVRGWLEQHTHGPDATLEQVVFVRGGARESGGVA